MGSVEHILLVLSVAIEKDAISKVELRQYLGRLSSLACTDSHPNDSAALRRFNNEIGKRFQSVMYPDGLESRDE
jgi:hypothetical protein